MKHTRDDCKQHSENNVFLYGPNPPEALINDNPRPSMPAFEGKLGDDKIADISTYVRWSWGNGEAGVDEGLVSSQR